MAKAAARQRRTVAPIVDDDNLLEQLVAAVTRIERGLAAIQETGNTIAERLDRVDRAARVAELERRLADERRGQAGKPTVSQERT